MVHRGISDGAGLINSVSIDGIFSAEVIDKVVDALYSYFVKGI